MSMFEKACPNCKTEGIDSNNFCIECGTKLALRPITPIEKELLYLGIGLIISGIIGIILHQFLNWIFAIIALIFGVIILFNKKPYMLILSITFWIFAAVWNIASLDIGWLIFGSVQLGIAVFEFALYRMYAAFG